MIWWIQLMSGIATVFTSHLIVSYDCVDVIAQKENYVPDYNIYHNLSMFISNLKDFSKRYPNYVSLSHQYISKNGESQLFTRLSNFSLDTKKKDEKIKILLAYGEHAREFFPAESLLYFLTNITSGTNCLKDSCDKNNHAYKFSAWVLSNFDFYIIAMTNPDGRLFLEKTKNYCWRGTAAGVDLNRNFDWNFGQKGSSSNPKDDEYRGLHAFSEPETKIFQQITKDIPMDAYVSFHSGIRHIYIPYADSLSKTTHRVPYNKDHMKHLAERMSKASSLRPFKYGVASDLSGYFADGTSFDYMSGVQKIPFSFAIELWEHKRHRGRSCFDEFNPHSVNLQRELVLVHPLYVELLLYLYQWKIPASKDNLKIDLKQIPLARYKKDGDHLRFPQRNDDPMFSSESVDNEEESSVQSHLKFLMSILLISLILCLIFKQVLLFVRKKRVINLRSLSSTFSMLRNL